MKKNIGIKIRDIRKRKGYSQEFMAKQLNISDSAYNRIENGETNSWSEHLDNICKVLAVEPEEILLSEEKFLQINNQTIGPSYGYGNTIINNPYDKIVELYEKLILEKDAKIADLESKLIN